MLFHTYRPLYGINTLRHNTQLLIRHFIYPIHKQPCPSPHSNLNPIHQPIHSIFFVVPHLKHQHLHPRNIRIMSGERLSACFLFTNKGIAKKAVFMEGDFGGFKVIEAILVDMVGDMDDGLDMGEGLRGVETSVAVPREVL